LVHVVTALLGEIAEDGQSSVITVKTDIAGNDPANPATSIGNSIDIRGPDYDPSLLYILEFCTVISCRDSTTTEAVARPVINTLMQLLRTPGRFHHLVTARATFYGLKLLHASYEFGYANVPILLHAISSFSLDLLGKSHTLILQGIALCVQLPGPLRNELMTSPDFWAILHTLARTPKAAPAVFGVIELSVTDMPLAILAGNYEAVIDLLHEFATAAGAHSGTASNSTTTTTTTTTLRKTIKSSSLTTALPDSDQSHNGAVLRGMRAIGMIYQMTGRVPQLMQQSHLESSEAWSAYWLPIFQSFTTQCTNQCRDVRSLAFTSLQRSLLSPDIVSAEANEWISIFGKVLFPLILKLLKPEVFSQRDYMGEMRVQSASLLCKVFLQYLVLLSTWDGMLDLWLRIIDIMDRLMNSGQGDSLEEAVRENLKNVVLFMSSNGFLISKTEDKSQQQLWLETWTRIDRFLPDLREDLALEDGPIPIEKVVNDAESD
jgi:brefeldin A-resistance guanine nucleotide exchange factor 1